jgi:FkbM family methyltransferase
LLNRVVRIVKRTVAHVAKRVINVSKVYSCKVRNHVVLLDVDSEIEKYRASTYVSKEPETLDWIERYFNQGDVMYDVGANIGLYSLFAAKHLSGNCKIFAFEPEALNYAKLNTNIYLNKLTGSIVPCCLALTDKIQFDNFYLNPNNFEEVTSDRYLTAGSALHSFGVAEDYRHDSFHPFHIQGMIGVSLDHLWKNWGIDFPNHIKIDVDGIEEKIIEGGLQTLSDRRLKSVLIEVSSDEIESSPIIQKLSSEGFKRVMDFELHSSVSLKGTDFENSINAVFIRGL